MLIRREAFAQNLNHCGLHVLASAAPSFIIAVQSNWNTTQEIAAMVLGVFSFLLLSAIVLSLECYQSFIADNAWNRAIFWGKRIRIFQALGATLSLLLEPMSRFPLPFLGVFVIPEFMAGITANSLTTSLFQWFVEPIRTGSFQMDSYPATRKALNLPVFRSMTNNRPGVLNADSFWQTYATTLVEGFILATALILLCFVIRLFFWGKTTYICY